MMDDFLIGDDFATAVSEPFKLFNSWFKDAKGREINDPEAMSLSTVDEEGMPNVRMVLLKEVSENGFVFYTNYESRKGQEILSSMKAALCFHWKSLHRQVRVRGFVEKVTSSEADAYYTSRHRNSQIGAWASKQSRPLESRFALEKAIIEYTTRYAVGFIPRPPYWSGFRIQPLSMEFWRNRSFRLHDRIHFTRANLITKAWNSEYLYP